MPGESESQVRRSGRLFAAVAVLRFLADPGKRLPGADAFTGKDSPEQRINALKSNPYEALLEARKQGGARWEAAVTVFRSIPGLLEQGPLPHTDTIGQDRLPDFIAGYDAQLAQLKEDFPTLLN
ncbi:hypothetical protein [Streptomyces camelliae]|uniref:EcoEI R protein C-terminal domain-containing protein n=1 Tax=Streptomyces camelliae TaxID=3004093 RepID=A0ABY7P6I7_9ACTN|nr:hypothetical protein [Streptomyces sp. HUAS 2-6]WBO66188.1 hypothetical protein O1G22_26970 [Streptomyces sp. HUAS 2-6]